MQREGLAGEGREGEMREPLEASMSRQSTLDARASRWGALPSTLLRGAGLRSSIARGLCLLVALAITGCASNHVSRVRAAQDSFSHGASLENETKLGLTTESIAEDPAVYYGLAYGSVESAINESRSKLERDQLYGVALVLKALSAWRLGRGDEAIGVCREVDALAGKGAEQSGPLVGPRDRAICASLRWLIEIDNLADKVRGLDGVCWEDGLCTHRAAGIADVCQEPLACEASLAELGEACVDDRSCELRDRLIGESCSGAGDCAFRDRVTRSGCSADAEARKRAMRESFDLCEAERDRDRYLALLDFVKRAPRIRDGLREAARGLPEGHPYRAYLARAEAELVFVYMSALAQPPDGARIVIESGGTTPADLVTRARAQYRSMRKQALARLDQIAEELKPIDAETAAQLESLRNDYAARLRD